MCSARVDRTPQQLAQLADFAAQPVDLAPHLVDPCRRAPRVDTSSLALAALAEQVTAEHAFQTDGLRPERAGTLDVPGNPRPDRLAAEIGGASDELVRSRHVLIVLALAMLVLRALAISIPVRLVLLVLLVLPALPALPVLRVRALIAGPLRVRELARALLERRTCLARAVLVAPLGELVRVSLECLEIASQSRVLLDLAEPLDPAFELAHRVTVAALAGALELSSELRRPSALASGAFAHVRFAALPACLALFSLTTQRLDATLFLFATRLGLDSFGALADFVAGALGALLVGFLLSDDLLVGFLLSDDLLSDDTARSEQRDRESQ